MLKKRSLGFRLIAGGVAGVVIPLLAVGILAVYRASTSIQSMAEQQTAQVARNLAGMVDLFLAEELKLAKTISANNVVTDAVRYVDQWGLENADVKVIRLNSELMALKKRLGKSYETIVVADCNGRVFADSEGGKFKDISIKERGYFKSAAAGSVTVGDVVASKGSGQPVIPVCAAVKNMNAAFAGVIVAVLRLDAFSDVLVSTRIGKSGYPFMVDQSGALIAHPDKNLVLKSNVKKIAGMQGLAEKMIGRRSGHGEYSVKGVQKIVGFAPVKLKNWSVAFAQDRSELLALARSIRNVILVVGGIFLLLTVGAVTYFSHDLLKPVRRIIGSLDQASEMMTSASAQISTASGALAEGSSEQASSLEETSSSLEEMASMTRQNADNAAKADSLIKNADKTVIKARTSMEALTGAIDAISSASQETARIIKTIDEVAFQTNLLALNAAVEAARAGEAGAGFAVVADEVRNLAIRAAEAAKDTASLIEGTLKKVDDGTDLVSRTQEEFSRVAREVSSVTTLISEISAASAEQAQGVEQINQAVTDMDRITQQTAASAEKSASTSEDLKHQADQLQAAVHDLAGFVQGASRVRQANSSAAGEAGLHGQEADSQPSTRGTRSAAEDGEPLEEF